MNWDYPTNLVDLLDCAVKKYTQLPLFGYKRDSEYHWISYQEFSQRVGWCRSAFQKLQPSLGDKVCVISANNIEFATTCYAAYGQGMIVVPLHWSLKIETLLNIIGRVKPRILVLESKFLSKLEKVFRRVDSIQHIISVDKKYGDYLTFEELLNLGKSEPVAPRRPLPDETAAILFTSGTSGDSKGVVLSHKNIITNVIDCAKSEVCSQDRSISILPWSHAFGFTTDLHCTLLVGASTVFPESLQKLRETFTEIKPTYFFGVPFLYEAFHDGIRKKIDSMPKIKRKIFRSLIKLNAKAKGSRVGFFPLRILSGPLTKILGKPVKKVFGERLKFTISGGSKLNPDIASFFRNLGINLLEGYGMTELSPIVSAQFLGNGTLPVGSVGKPLEHVRVRIVPVEDSPPQWGEIVVYGNTVMKEYYEAPEETQKVLTEDGGFRTGDLGRIDEEGNLWVTGRIKEKYKLSNGEYIIPGGIESPLTLSPLIKQVVLYGENRPYNIAIVVCNEPELRKVLKPKDSDINAIYHSKEFESALFAEVKAKCGNFQPHERPLRFIISKFDFTYENQFLSYTKKIRRWKIKEVFEGAIDALYKGNEKILVFSEGNIQPEKIQKGG